MTTAAATAPHDAQFAPSAYCQVVGCPGRTATWLVHPTSASPYNVCSWHMSTLNPNVARYRLASPADPITFVALLRTDQATLESPLFIAPEDAARWGRAHVGRPQSEVLEEVGVQPYIGTATNDAPVAGFVVDTYCDREEGKPAIESGSAAPAAAGSCE